MIRCGEARQKGGRFARWQCRWQCRRRCRRMAARWCCCGSRASCSKARMRAVAQQSAEAEAPEPIEADDDDMAFVVKRTGAQLAECAVDPAAANAELLFVPRAGKRVPWPALVQTRAIALGEPLRWVYNSNPTTPMGRQIRQWRRQEEELQELRASAEAARRQRRTDLNRDIRGRFKKDGRLKCV